MSGQRDSTCQKNDLPKSLQGAEDAEFVWGLITERFPNAAPLLCEMEAVIDRAEDLLQQLRAPCCREIETSTSFYSPDSEESTSMISAGGSMILRYFGDDPRQFTSLPEGPVIVEEFTNDEEYQ